MSATETKPETAETTPPEDTTRSEEWTPSTRGWLARFAVLVIVFGGILLITSQVPGYWADRIALAAVWAIIGLSLNIVLGYVGQVSLGHHGFIGIGAFVAAYYATEKANCAIEAGGECPVGAFATATLLAILTGALAAGLLGLAALRIRGLYLALITLAYGLMATDSIFEIPALTGGGAGTPAPRPAGFTSDRAFAFLCFAFLTVVLFIDWRLLRSKAGRAILAVKHSEPVAASYGVNVTAYKILAFVLSGVFAGLAGSLLAFQAGLVQSSLFQFNTALLWVLMVVVGGLGNRTGVVIGSAFFALFPFLLEAIKPVEHFLTGLLNRSEDEIGEITLVVGALLAVLTMIQFPGGIAEQISPITRWLRGERFSMHHGKAKKHKASPLERFKKSRAKEPEPTTSATETTATDEGAPDSSNEADVPEREPAKARGE